MATHPCEWAHEGETCTYSAFKFFPGAYLRALPVYLPVYVLPAILVHRCELAMCPSIRHSVTSVFTHSAQPHPVSATQQLAFLMQQASLKRLRLHSPTMLAPSDICNSHLLCLGRGGKF